MPGPYSPEELARVSAYWGASPANSSVPGAAPVGPAPVDLGAQAFGGPPPVAPPPSPPPGAFNVPGPMPADFQAKLDAQFGHPATAQPVDPVTRAPEWDPASINPKTISFTAPKPPPAPAGGPTAADNAAFEQARARIGAQSTPRNSGPARPGNPDPYGTRAATKALLGTYDAQADAVRRAHTAEGDKAIQIATHTQELARRREEDASINQLEAQSVAEHMDTRMSEIERQLDDVRTKKIDPNRLMKESPGMGLLAVVGGVIGGIYQGLTNGQENGFLRDLNRMIDRDIAAQERDMDNDTKHFGEKLNLLSQQRAVWKDTQTAKLQTQNLYYEAAKENIAAEAARFDTPIYQARADEAIANIQRQQDEIRLKLASQLQAQAAAAGAQNAARAKEVRDVMRETYDKALAAGLSPAQAEYEMKRIAGVIYAPAEAGARQGTPGAGAGADPISLVPKVQQKDALEELGKHDTAEKGIGAIRNAFGQMKGLGVTAGPWDRDRDALKANIKGGYKLALGPGMSSDKDAEAFLDPLMPAYGDSEATLARKQALIESTVRSKVATPVLDRHAPGWRPKEVAYKDVK